MQLKPDELPDLVEGMIKRVTLSISGVIGANTISSATATSDTLTIGSASISGSDVSFLVTADNVGTHYILVSATLSSGEIEKAYIRVKVVGQPCESSSDDYDD